MNNIKLLNKLIYYPNVKNDVHYSLHNGVVLFFENITKSKSIIIITREIIREDILNKISMISDLFKDGYTCKLIGNDSFINQLLPIMSESNVKVTNQIIRNDEFEIVYFPLKNKLRLNKQDSNSETPKLIKTLIVDDSPTIRNLLNKILVASKKFEVVGSLGDPLEVDTFLQKNHVDLITLDIHMPNLNGVELLKEIFPKYHIPTVMISSIRIEEGPYIMEALEIGAVDYIEKPSLSELDSITPYLIEKLKSAANSKTKRAKPKINKSISISKIGYKKDSLILIGASTGGVEALKVILEQLPENIPPIIIVQHIPEVFSKALANRLDKLCKFTVKEAEPQEEVTKNKVLIAPGGKHLKLIEYSGTYRVILHDGEKVNRFKPSVDVLFKSAAECCPKNTVAALLTGMGRDGASGLLSLHEKGVKTIAQDEQSCVVFGMPREAIELGAADHILPLNDIPEKIIKFLSK